MNQLVVVLSRDYASGLSVIRSLGAAGYTVDFVAGALSAGQSAIAASSKYVHKAAEVVYGKGEKASKEAEKKLIEELLAHKGKKGAKPILFPTDDFSVAVVDRHRSELEPFFLTPSILDGDGLMTPLMDKNMQAKMARRADFCTPREWTFDLSREIALPADMVFPCFCKRLDSVTGHPAEMAVCEDEAEFWEHMDRIRRRWANKTVLVQEYLHIDHEINVQGVCLDQDVIAPAIIRKRHVAKHEMSAAVLGEVISFDKYPGLQEKIAALLRQFRYVGMFDVELNIVGNQIYFNEVDLRCAVHNDAYFMSGVNLPDLFVKGLLGKVYSSDETAIKEYGKSFVNEKAAWEDYIFGHMTKKELHKIMDQADVQILFDENDPMPRKLFGKKMHMFEIKYHLRKYKRGFMEAIKPGILGVLPVIFGYPQTKRENKENRNSKNPRVIVAGRNYASNLCLARAFGKAGYDVEVLRIYQRLPKIKRLLGWMHPDAYSKYIKAHYVCVTHNKSLNLVDKLQEVANPNRKTLLIPADDLVASIADEYYDELKKLYLIPNLDGRQGAIGQMMNKDLQTNLATAAGLPVINSCVIRSCEGQFEIPDTVKYPCFIKPNVSKNSSKTKMQRCNDREELHAALSLLAQSKDFEMKVEDFVDIRQEFAILGLSTKNGVIAPGFFGTEYGGHGGQRGIAMAGRVLPRDDQKELIDNVCRFIQTLNYEGLFDVDLIESKDGTLYFVELNLRYGGSGYAIVESGANLPGMFADYMLMNKPVDMDCCVQPGKTFINERVMLGEYKEDYLTRAEMKDWMEKVDIHFVYDKEDMAAYKCYKRMAQLTSVKKFLKGRKKDLKQDEQ